MKYLLILLLAGCSSGAWYPEPALAAPVLWTVHTDFPCGRKTANGCWNRAAQTVEVKKGLSQIDEWCVLQHEYKHADGWNHGDQAHYYRMDCGNG